jgi:endo-1,4-beta-xylanase
VLRSLVLILLLVLIAGCGDAPTGAAEREPFPAGAADGIEDPRTGVPLGTALSWAVAKDDPELQAVVRRAFDSVTPENELKAQFVQPEQGSFAFGDADALVDWARGAGLRVRGHTLVWHQQVPDWLGDGDREPAELEEILVEHVRTVVGRYRGRIDTWDVVNEPFTDRGEPRSDDGFPFLDGLGPRYVEIALRAARAADPEARLVVNEIGAEAGGPKLDALVRFAREAKARGVPLDAIGLEAHLDARDAPGRARVQETIERLVAADVDVEITELDVAAGSASPERQAEVYRDVAAACAAVPRCTRLTIWGVSDRDSWLGPDVRALPFDAQLRPKPAWNALTAALRREAAG